jgi:benzoate-CoA ligase
MEERVLLLLPDTPEFAYSFFGAIKIGAVPVPVNTLLRANEYEHFLNDTRARVAIVGESFVHTLLQIPRERLSFLEHLIVVGAGGAPSVTASFSTTQFADFLQSHHPQLTAAPTCKDDAAFWLYSSGSTGSPKACIHLQHSMVAAAEQYALKVLRICESDRFFSVAKLFFAYGLGNGLYFPLAVGGTSILFPGRASPQNIHAVIQRHRPTLFFSVPSNFAALTEYRGEPVGDPRGKVAATKTPKEEFDLSSIRLAVSAGEALPAGLCERFTKRFGIEVLDGIGSTEALHIFISNIPGEVRPGSCGRVVPGCEARILDEQRQPVRVGEIGNLWLKSDATFAGYWNHREQTKQTMKGEWISTGDKFYQDEAGYYWFAGRADDMLKVSGVWVGPSEIESVLMEHESVAEAGVAAQQDKDGLSKPVAWVVLRPGYAGSSELAAALLEFVIARLPSYKRPRRIEFVAELPRTATGKLRRFELRQTCRESWIL